MITSKLGCVDIVIMMMHIKETTSATNQNKHTGVSYNTMVLAISLFFLSLDSVAN